MSISILTGSLFFQHRLLSAHVARILHSASPFGVGQESALPHLETCQATATTTTSATATTTITTSTTTTAATTTSLVETSRQFVDR